VIVLSDHSQAPVEERIRLDEAFADFDVATPSAARSIGAEVAISPAQRSAMVYVLDSERREQVLARAVEASRATSGVDLVLWLAPGDEAVVQSARGELRFAAGGAGGGARGRSLHEL
jgi:hypothetical protein